MFGLFAVLGGTLWLCAPAFPRSLIVGLQVVVFAKAGKSTLTNTTTCKCGLGSGKSRKKWSYRPCHELLEVRPNLKEAPRLAAYFCSSGGSCSVVVAGASVGSQLKFVRRVLFSRGCWRLG